MNSVLLHSKQHQGDHKYLIEMPYQLEHIRDHLKLRRGDQFKANLVQAGIGMATILEMNHQSILVEVKELVLTIQKKIHLIVGISRPPTMKKILEHGTCMGVTHFTFIPAKLSEKSYFTSKIYQEDQLNELLCLGLEQSAHFSQWPIVKLESSIPTINEAGTKILLHPDVPQQWNQFNHKNEKQLTLAIGPERGWTSEEVQMFQSQDYQLMSMGSSRLRTEIAVFAALGHLL